MMKWQENLNPLVIQAVNNLLINKYSPNRKQIIIKQNEIITEIMCLMGDIPVEQKEIKRKELFSKNQLDIEEIYQEKGWKVKYDKPGYSETYDAFFEFDIPQ